MSLSIWYQKGEKEFCIELDNTMPALKGFAAMEKIAEQAGSGEDYELLLRVPGEGDRLWEEDEFETIQTQAKKMIGSYRPLLSADAIFTLDKIVEGGEEAEDIGDEERDGDFRNG